VRLVGIMRWVRRYALHAGVKPEIWFLTSSEAEGFLFHERFAAFKLPSKTIVDDSGIDKLAYLALAKQWVWHSLGLLRPDLLVVDTFPRGSFGELLGALDLCQKTAFIYRPVKPDIEGRPDFQAMLPLYDRVIVPESASRVTVRAPAATRLSYAGPTLVRERVEMLPRTLARERLGLPDDRPAVLISAGGGGDALADAQLHAALTALESLPVSVAVAAGPLYRGTPVRRPGLVWLTQGGLAELLPAFDVAVAAAGYNTFHELMLAGVPAVLLPQPKIADDQHARAALAQEAGAAIVLPNLEPHAIGAAVSQLLSDPKAPDAARNVVPRNHARQIAQTLLDLVLPSHLVARAADALDDDALVRTAHGLPGALELLRALAPDESGPARAELAAALRLEDEAQRLGLPRVLLGRIAVMLARKLPPGHADERADAVIRLFRALAPFHDWGAAQTLVRLLHTSRVDGFAWLDVAERALSRAKGDGRTLHDVVRQLSGALALDDAPGHNEALFAVLLGAPTAAPVPDEQQP
jgi:predicted glycosyltransferase